MQLKIKKEREKEKQIISTFVIERNQLKERASYNGNI